MFSSTGQHWREESLARKYHKRWECMTEKSENRWSPHQSSQDFSWPSLSKGQRVARKYPPTGYESKHGNRGKNAWKALLCSSRLLSKHQRLMTSSNHHYVGPAAFDRYHRTIMEESIRIIYYIVLIFEWFNGHFLEIYIRYILYLAVLKIY